LTQRMLKEGNHVTRLDDLSKNPSPAKRKPSGNAGKDGKETAVWEAKRNGQLRKRRP